MPVVAAIPYVVMAASAAASVMSAQAANKAGQNQQAVSNYNASVANQQAATVQNQAETEANIQRTQNQQILAKQRAGYAAAGVVGNTGSPLIEESHQAGYLELKALDTEYKGNIAAQQYTQQAGLDTMQGSIDRSAGAANANATLLKGAATVGSEYKGIK